MYDITVFDEMSHRYGNQDGQTLCGLRTYTIQSSSNPFTDPYGVTTVVTQLSTNVVTDDTLTISSNDIHDADITNYLSMTYTEVITITLNNYSSTTSTITVVITV